MPDHALRPRDVPPQRLGRLIDRLPGSRLDGDPMTLVTGITQDSREVRPGDLYIARAGDRSHGIDHVGAALRAGAVAVLTDPAAAPGATSAGAAAVVVVADPRAAMGPAAAWTYADPSSELLLIGVTGTNGKTTTVYLLEAGLRAAGRRTGLVGTIETRIDGEAMASARTTPEATDLHALFAVMRERGVDAAAMEVSSHALALGRVDGIRFEAAAFTNLSQDHLDFHHDMAEYFAAKASLFTPERAHRAVVCVDDGWGAQLARQASVPVVSVGRAESADWRQRDDVDEGVAGGRTTLVDPNGGTHQLRCRLIGRVNLSNAAIAFVTLVAAGIDADAARTGIAGLTSIPGRMEPIDVGQPYVAIVDYAHTPQAVATLLADARRLAAPGRQVSVVLGCGGDRDRAKRPAMGSAAATGADLAIFTNDNPRSEDPQLILAAMQAGVPAGAAVVVEPDRRAAIARAIAVAEPGDVVVVAGKGHEQGQEIGADMAPFDDRVVVREAILATRAETS
jgi:UDP-N-acetylmuramoyl-L-alanyl-D-glutamate--2,6-diaminopimelate ligase